MSKVGYLSFGSIKKDAEHGPLMSRVVQAFAAAVGTKGHKRELIRRLEVSQALDEVGAADTVVGLYLAHRAMFDDDPEQGRRQVKKALADMLYREVGLCAPHSVEPADRAEPPATAPPARTPSGPVERPQPSEPEPVASSSAESEPRAPADDSHGEDEEETPRGLGGLMSLQQ